MVYFLEVFVYQFTNHQGKDMFSAILSLSVGTETSFWYKGGGGVTLLWSCFCINCFDSSSAGDKSYYAKCASRLHTMTQIFSRCAENGNVFSGRLESGNTAVNFSNPNNKSILFFSGKVFKCLKSRIWGFELCLVFPFHLQYCKCVFMIKVADSEWRGRKLKSKD